MPNSAAADPTTDGFTVSDAPTTDGLTVSQTTTDGITVSAHDPSGEGITVSEAHPETAQQFATTEPHADTTAPSDPTAVVEPVLSDPPVLTDLPLPVDLGAAMPSGQLPIRAEELHPNTMADRLLTPFIPKLEPGVFSERLAECTAVMITPALMLTIKTAPTVVYLLWQKPERSEAFLPIVELSHNDAMLLGSAPLQLAMSATAQDKVGYVRA